MTMRMHFPGFIKKTLLKWRVPLNPLPPSTSELHDPTGNRISPWNSPPHG